MTCQVYYPKIMEVGGGTINKIDEVLLKLGCKYPLIITDKIMVEVGYVNKLSEIILNKGLHYDIFQDTVPEPTETSVINATNYFKSKKFDSIIALGGGSPIDTAKAVNILANYGGVMRDYKFPQIFDKPGVPLIAIPTTAGTGSEVSRFTIITDMDKDEKMLCVGLGFMPDVALIDYELTMSLPSRITADTGIDALTHSIEAYVSRKSSPFSDSQALAAMRLIAPNLRTVYNDSSNKKAREALMLGSTLAGIAFSASSVALVHGMSRPIGAYFHVSHGLSNALLLPKITEYSILGNERQYAECAIAMGIAKEEHSIQKSCDLLLEELYSINDDLDVPTLSEIGIDKEKYFEITSIMAEQALASGSPANNPRVPSKEEIITLYENIWT